MIFKCRIIVLYWILLFFPWSAIWLLLKVMTMLSFFFQLLWPEKIWEDWENYFYRKIQPRWNLIKLMCFTISLDIFLIFAFILNVCDINGCLTSRRDNWNFCKKRPRFPRHKAVWPLTQCSNSLKQVRKKNSKTKIAWILVNLFKYQDSVVKKTLNLAVFFCQIAKENR